VRKKGDSSGQQYRKASNKDLPKPRRRILAIDDDPGVQDILQIIFERAGYIAEIKSDGADIFRNHFSIPDIFLIDKQLSGSNGLDICRYLKSNKATKDIPVVMISASPDIVDMAINAGADGYIEKPFEIAQLLKVIDQHLQKKKGRLQGGGEI